MRAVLAGLNTMPVSAMPAAGRGPPRWRIDSSVTLPAARISSSNMGHRSSGALNRRRERIGEQRRGAAWILAEHTHVVDLAVRRRRHQALARATPAISGRTIGGALRIRSCSSSAIEKPAPSMFSSVRRLQ